MTYEQEKLRSSLELIKDYTEPGLVVSAQAQKDLIDIVQGQAERINALERNVRKLGLSLIEIREAKPKRRRSNK